MSQLDILIVRSHQKIIDHYRWLFETATSETERERYRQRIVQEHEALARYTKQQRPDCRCAA